MTDERKEEIVLEVRNMKKYDDVEFNNLVSLVDEWEEDRCHYYPSTDESLLDETNYIKSKLFDSHEMMFTLVQHDPTALAFAICQTEELVRESVKANPFSFVFAFDEFREDREFCLDLMNENPGTVLAGISEKTDISFSEIISCYFGGYKPDKYTAEDCIKVSKDIVFGIFSNPFLSLGYILEKIVGSLINKINNESFYSLYIAAVIESSEIALHRVGNMPDCYNKEVRLPTNSKVKEVFERIYKDEHHEFTLTIRDERNFTKSRNILTLKYSKYQFLLNK